MASTYTSSASEAEATRSTMFERFLGPTAAVRRPSATLPRVVSSSSTPLQPSSKAVVPRLPTRMILLCLRYISVLSAGAMLLYLSQTSTGMSRRSRLTGGGEDITQRRLSTVLDDSKDPYRQPGYLWRPLERLNETRYIPFKESDLFEQEIQEISALADPPTSALERAAPPFHKWISQPGAAADPRLQFLRNKHLVFNCDSHCATMVDGFCWMHRDEIQAEHNAVRHVGSRCYVPGLNFTISLWFHYGLVDEHDDWNAISVNEPKPIRYESRITDIFKPEADLYGKPDLLIFDSSFWDVVYFKFRGQEMEKYFVEPDDRNGLTYSEMLLHRRRLAEMVAALKKEFPNSPIMYKTSHQRGCSTRTSSMDITQINASTRLLMQQLGIPVFDWADKLTGDSQFREDGHHFIHYSYSTWLGMDMALYYLWRLAEQA